MQAMTTEFRGIHWSTTVSVLLDPLLKWLWAASVAPFQVVRIYYNRCPAVGLHEGDGRKRLYGLTTTDVLRLGFMKEMAEKGCTD